MKRLIEESEIQEKVSALGEQIAHDYRDRPLTVLGVLTGSIVLLSDLIRKIDLPLRVGLIQASSYRGTGVTAGDLTINSELLPDITNRDVLLVDDIFDSGRTIATLMETVRKKNPNSVRSAVLLKKEKQSVVGIEPDYFCFEIPNLFVVGYGLDYNDEYRHLPYIAELEDEDLSVEG